MLKVVGDDESVGVTLTNGRNAVTKLTDDLITINNPSSLTLLLPADLAEGRVHADGDDAVLYRESFLENAPQCKYANLDGRKAC